jgi:hypothetical protein
LQIVIQVLEDLEFEGLVFRGRLHHEVRFGHIRKIGSDLDAAQDRILVFCRNPALVHTLAKDFGNVGQPFFSEFDLDVAHDDIQAGGGRHLGDAVAHLSGADNAEGIDVHFLTPPLDV